MKRIILLAVLILSGAAFAAGASKSRGGKRGPIYITQYHTKGTINQRGRGRGQNPGASQRRGQQTHSRYRSSGKGRAAGLSKGSRSNASARAKRK